MPTNEAEGEVMAENETTIGRNPQVMEQQIEALNKEIHGLRQVLESYASCRHGQELCNCTKEARAALYPYLRRDRMMGDKS